MTKTEMMRLLSKDIQTIQTKYQGTKVPFFYASFLKQICIVVPFPVSDCSTLIRPL